MANKGDLLQVVFCLKSHFTGVLVFLSSLHK